MSFVQVDDSNESDFRIIVWLIVDTKEKTNEVLIRSSILNDHAEKLLLATYHQSIFELFSYSMIFFSEISLSV